MIFPENVTQYSNELHCYREAAKGGKRHGKLRTQKAQVARAQAIPASGTQSKDVETSAKKAKTTNPMHANH